MELGIGEPDRPQICLESVLVRRQALLREYRRKKQRLHAVKEVSALVSVNPPGQLQTKYSRPDPFTLGFVKLRKVMLNCLIILSRR
jgi:hypothetical protein